MTPTTSLPDPLPILPFTRPTRGEVALPGSKSITNRALLLSALCEDTTTLTGALFSEDTDIMAEALAKLGFAVDRDPAASVVRVKGRGGLVPAGRAKLSVGNSGTAARFLCALCAMARTGVYGIDGSSRMRERPMEGLIEALRSQGARIVCLKKPGFLPISIEAHGLSGGIMEIDASESSQMLSALLMVAPFALSRSRLALAGKVREPFVRMTRRMMAEFGGNAAADDGAVATGVYRSPGTYEIEPDATAASYFKALEWVTKGSLSFPRLRSPDASLQGDTSFASVIRGLDTRATSGRTFDFSEMSDTFLTLAAIAPLLQGTTRITGLAHTRKQETDRVAGMADELKRLGQQVDEAEDSLTITPQPLKPGQTIETYGDHRFAMSFAVLGCHDLLKNGRTWLAIRDPGCCAKTFPRFFEVLEGVRKRSVGTET